MSVSQFVIGKIVDLAHRSPGVTDFVFARLAGFLDRSYTATTGLPEELDVRRAFGRCLQPFLSRLIRERPAAAKAIVRFAVQWSRDVRRRNERLEQGRCAPATVVIEPTDRCNLDCPGCYAHSTHDGADLPYDVIREIIAQTRDLGTTLITLSGGEPFLREGSDRTISRLAGEFPDLGFLVYTNGTLIDEEIARRLGRCGNVFPAISVEGSRHQTDARRSRGVYDHSHRARTRLARHQVMYGFSATATRANADALAQDCFLDERIESGDLFGWYFIYQPIGRAPRPELMVTARQRAALRDSVHRARQQGRPLFLGDFWNDGHLTGGCLAGGRYYFHVYANGDISPCVFSPVACGNVHDLFAGRYAQRNLADFLDTSPFCRRFREAQSRIRDHRAPCVLIDHPHLFRELTDAGGWTRAKNFPPGYLSGPIRDQIERAAADWQQVLSAEKQQSRVG